MATVIIMEINLETAREVINVGRKVGEVLNTQSKQIDGVLEDSINSAKELLSKSNIRVLAKHVNTLINVPLVPEALELVVIEHALTLIFSVLTDIVPNDVLLLMGSAGTGLDAKGINQLIERLTVAVNKRVDIPMLNEEQEAFVIKTALKITVQSMAIGKTILDFL